MSAGFTIQVMSRAQLDTAVDWAANEGWNPGLNDAGIFHAADPQGFLVGLQDGEPVACISVVRYGHRYGFLGFYIAAPGWRGKGRGFAVWEAGLQHLNERTVGLDGVVAQQDNYRKSGFVLAHRNIRYGGEATFGAA
ncbi:MAG: GNAT family N-acetyltransferase, partial [Ferrovibrio sp.]